MFLLSGIMLTGCNTTSENTDKNDSNDQKELTIEVGDTVKVNYVWALQEDDSIFDTSLEEVAKANDLFNPQRPYEPIEFIVGMKQMIPGFENGIMWMKVGDEKEILIAAADGYGEKTDEAIQEIPSQPFEEAGIEPQVGEQYNFGFSVGKVLEIGEGTIKVDFNHFLAGKDLKFQVTIIDIEKGDVIELGADEVGAEANVEEVVEEVIDAVEEAVEEDTAEEGDKENEEVQEETEE